MRRSGESAVLLIGCLAVAATSPAAPRRPAADRVGGLAGRVEDTRGAAVPGTVVRVRSRSGVVVRAVSGRDGTFLARGVRSQPAVIAVVRPGFAPACGVFDPEDGPLVLTLARGGQLEVRASAETGATAVEVSEPAADSACPSWHARHKLHRDVALFQHLPAGDAAVVLLAEDGTVLQEQEIEIRDEETAQIEFESRAILVSGHVTSGGRPLPGARVTMLGKGVVSARANGSRPQGPERLFGTTREDGAYELLVDVPGDYQVSVAGPDGSGYPLRPVSIPDTESVLLDLDLPAASLTGFVEDREADLPVENASVFVAPKKPGEASTAETRTGADGRFALTLNEGEYSLTVLAPGYLREEADVVVPREGTATVELTLRRGFVLEGRVLDAVGTGAPGVPVTARLADETWGPWTKTFTYTREDGSFRFEPLARGAYDLLAGPCLSGFAVQPRVPTGTSDLVLRLSPAGRLQIEVRSDPEGTPAPDAVVRVVRVGGLAFFGSDHGRRVSHRTRRIDTVRHVCWASSAASVCALQKMKHAWVCASGLCATLMLASCGVDPPGPVRDLDFTVAAEIGNRNAVDLTWTMITSQGFGPVRSFVVEVGTLSGISDVAVIDTRSAATSYRWSPAPIGTFFIRVKGQNEAGEGAPSKDVVVRSLDPRDFIEAIFLGSGPLKDEPPFCVAQGAMTGWLAGSAIRVLVSASLPAAHRDVVMKTVAQFAEATHGSVRGTVELVADPNPLPGNGEITITESPDKNQLRAACGSNLLGCAAETLGPNHTILAARVFLVPGLPNWVPAHEFGHAALGLCHMSFTRHVRPPPIMGDNGEVNKNDSWDPSTVKATEGVYGAGLTPGAGWAEFFAAGLVNPPSSSFSSPAPPTGTTALPEGWIVRRQGDETIVIKPICRREPPQEPR